MKKTIILLFCAIALYAGVLAWLNRTQVATDASSPESAPTRGFESNISEAPIATTVDHDSARLEATKAETESERAELLRQALEGKNVPVDFYGHVVDQDGKSLVGVQVNIRVRHWDMASLGASIPVSIRTDADGRFHVGGVTGDAFDIVSISKTEYGLEPNTKRTYSAVGGSHEDPVVFKMWRDNIKENLISGSKSFRIVPDGRTYGIDLKNGTIGESGECDLKVSIEYVSDAVRGQTYDWSAKISVPSGGLIEETNSNSSMYLAPTNGYTPQFQLDQQILGGQLGSIGTRRFYLRLDGGKSYARVEVEMNAPYNNQVPGRIRINYAVNPSGSRVLK